MAAGGRPHEARLLLQSTDTLLASTRDPNAQQARANEVTEKDGMVSAFLSLLQVH
jgi:hypothetical protein